MRNVRIPIVLVTLSRVIQSYLRYHCQTSFFNHVLPSHMDKEYPQPHPFPMPLMLYVFTFPSWSI